MSYSVLASRLAQPILELPIEITLVDFSQNEIGKLKCTTTTSVERVVDVLLGEVVSFPDFEVFYYLYSADSTSPQLTRFQPSDMNKRIATITSNTGTLVVQPTE